MGLTIGIVLICALIAGLISDSVIFALFGAFIGQSIVFYLMTSQLSKEIEELRKKIKEKNI